MYNESYEEYIRNILGYSNTNYNNCYENNYNAYMTNYRNNEKDDQLEACYPEIYKVVYPMVNKACDNNTKPVTPELVDKLTDEIYLAIENDNRINININLSNDVQSTKNRNVSNNTKVESSKEIRENRGEDRQFRNRGLQDLIRILLIQELLRRRRRLPGNRLPFPPNRPPMRPPFPRGLNEERTPIMQHYSNDFSNIYEQ